MLTKSDRKTPAAGQRAVASENVEGHPLVELLAEPDGEVDLAPHDGRSDVPDDRSLGSREAEGDRYFL
jgi:hypothetical protein